jgi:hypothetical protein
VVADVSKALIASLKHSTAMYNADVNLLWHFMWILEALKLKAKRRSVLARLRNVACPVSSFQSEE